MKQAHLHLQYCGFKKRFKYKLNPDGEPFLNEDTGGVASRLGVSDQALYMGDSLLNIKVGDL